MMHPMLNIAVRAARKAGQIINRGFSELDLVKTANKSENDFVTNIDRDAEAAIISVIKNAYPNHDIIGEESGHHEGSDLDYQWIIDPLDGTTNFIRGIPHFAVSIAMKLQGKTEIAVVYDPIRDEMFTSARGTGAQLDNLRIRVAGKKDLHGTVLATGFPFKYKHHFEAYAKTFSALFEYSADIRRCGSAALDLAYLAAGRYDGYWEIGLKPWDIAAGDLLVREAGGIISDFAGGHNYMASGNVVAANPKVMAHMMKTIKPHLTDSLKK